MSLRPNENHSGCSWRSVAGVVSRKTTRRTKENARRLLGRFCWCFAIFAQVEPMKIGENTRAMNITMGYGRRLVMASKTLLGPHGLDYLVSTYPDHGFVIDRTEAAVIFKDVRAPIDALTTLAELLGDRALYPPGTGAAGEKTFISSELPKSGAAKGTTNGTPAKQPQSKRSQSGRASPAGKGNGDAPRARATRAANRANGSSSPSS